MTPEEKKWYKKGAMAERKRCIRLALGAMSYDIKNCCHTISDDGHAIAQMIAKAQHLLPVDIKNTHYWSLYGERRLVRDVTSLMEWEEGPYTMRGRKLLEHLEKENERLLAKRTTSKYLRETIKALQRELRDTNQREDFYKQILRDLGMKQVP